MAVFLYGHVYNKQFAVAKLTKTFGNRCFSFPNGLYLCASKHNARGIGVEDFILKFCLSVFDLYVFLYCHNAKIGKIEIEIEIQIEIEVDHIIRAVVSIETLYLFMVVFIIIFGTVIFGVFCWAWVKFVNWILPTKKPTPLNPYIDSHLMRRANDKAYAEYLEWLDKDGGGLPIEKVKTGEELKFENELKNSL